MALIKVTESDVESSSVGQSDIDMEYGGEWRQTHVVEVDYEDTFRLGADMGSIRRRVFEAIDDAKDVLPDVASLSGWERILELVGEEGDQLWETQQQGDAETLGIDPVAVKFEGSESAPERSTYVVGTVDFDGEWDDPAGPGKVTLTGWIDVDVADHSGRGVIVPAAPELSQRDDKLEGEAGAGGLVEDEQFLFEVNAGVRASARSIWDRVEHLLEDESGWEAFKDAWEVVFEDTEYEIVVTKGTYKLSVRRSEESVNRTLRKVGMDNLLREYRERRRRERETERTRIERSKSHSLRRTADALERMAAAEGREDREELVTRYDEVLTVEPGPERRAELDESFSTVELRTLAGTLPSVELSGTDLPGVGRTGLIKILDENATGQS